MTASSWRSKSRTPKRRGRTCEPHRCVDRAAARACCEASGRGHQEGLRSRAPIPSPNSSAISKKGKLRGIGFCSYIEACRIAPSSLVGALGARAGLYEAATVRVNPTGSVSVMTGSTAQPRPGPRDDFRAGCCVQAGHPGRQRQHRARRHQQGAVRHGHLRLALAGRRRLGDRQRAEQSDRQGQDDDGPHLLEAAEGDIEFKDGAYTVKGTDKKKTFGEIALTAYVPHKYPIDKIEPGLEETAFYDPKNFAYPCRHLHLRSGNRSAHGRNPHHAVRGGRRLRQHRQPDDRRGPGARRLRPGHWPGHAGRRGLR